jgi:hypothetical protein
MARKMPFCRLYVIARQRFSDLIPWNRGVRAQNSRSVRRATMAQIAEIPKLPSLIVRNWRFVVIVGMLAVSGRATAEPIDRRALVARHDPVVERFDPESPLSVGNGQFAFTVDATGLQTFPQAFDETIPLGTLSHWGWHTSPNHKGWSIDKYHFTEFNAHGRKVGYADVPGDKQTAEVAWLRANPHRLHLGRIGFRLTKSDGQPAVAADLTDVHQTLRLWDGVLVSHFQLEGQRVEVETVCHPTLDLVAVRVTSPLVAKGQVAIELKFPYGTGDVKTADWDHPDAHETSFVQPAADVARFGRRLDDDRYQVAARWSRGGKITRTARHEFVVVPAHGKDSLEFECWFAPKLSADPPGFDATAALTREHWHRFWTTGGAIDLSGSTDPRWRELERRIVLSQYLTAIQCSGNLPPQETGLTYNSWNGKFHLEMHWWHAVHFALWNRWPMLERSLGYYQRILPQAEATARRQGYSGARWPKMTDPAGAESPSTIGPFLIWQQPHPIYYAELAYRQDPQRSTLEKYQAVVFATAEFMKSYAAWDGDSDSYVLGPVLQSAQERFPKDATLNPTFELTYWRWGLETAQKWRERLGMPREPEWDRVLEKLAQPLVVDGKYAFTATTPDSYTKERWNDDHPAVLAAFGMLPGPGIDRPTMHRTFDWVWQHWNWPNTWGWDYPMVAMSAARLGEPARAVDALLLDTPKNFYRVNGHNHQRPGLTIYLPGNGGLLTATAMMAAGWDGAPDRHAPGFPDDGTWKVRWENLRRLP